ncbi:hypothetical protein PQR64_33905 [Paraburkholderia phytofirmans]|uniref:hypothetical protein n=1 Tax=Paraburkholderia phytofirmans TaxID=261302 RepID=UPI0038B821DD
MTTQRGIKSGEWPTLAGLNAQREQLPDIQASADAAASGSEIQTDTKSNTSAIASTNSALVSEETEIVRAGGHRYNSTIQRVAPRESAKKRGRDTTICLS